MSGANKQIEVKCPICETVKNITVPEAIFAQKKFGTIKIQVPAGAVCKEHQFIVFVDTKGIVRGYEKIDLMMGMAPEEVKKKTDDGKTRINMRTLIGMYGLYGVMSLIHAKVFNYPSFIMISPGEEDLTDILNKIGEAILPEKYRGSAPLKFIEETDYGKLKIKEKDALVMDSRSNILQTPWVEKLKFEEEIIKKSLEIINEDEQMILLQQDVARFTKEAEYVVKVLEDVKEIYEDDLIDQLAQDLHIPKINHYRVTLIKDFIRRRHSKKLPSKIKNKVEEFLNLL